MRLTSSRLLLAMVAGGLLVNLFFTAKLIYREAHFIRRYPQLSREQKMRTKVGGWVIDFTTFVNDHSPPNSVLMIPPQRAPWTITGHREMISYYVYPRRVVNGPSDPSESAIRHHLKSHPEVTHLILTSEGELWPGIRPAPGEEVRLLRPGWGLAQLGK